MTKLIWIPRILAIAFALFISMFALDVFSEGYGFPEVLLALFMHLIPTFLIIGVTMVAWKRMNLGGSLFVVLALFSLIQFNTYKELP